MEELRVRRFTVIQEELCCRAVRRWAILESVTRLGKKELSLICVKVVV